MNGTSGFQEVRSSISRSSTNRLLDEQQPQFGIGSGNRFRTHNLIAPSTGISTKRHMAPETFSMFSRLGSGVSSFLVDTELAEQPHPGKRIP